MVRKSSGEEEKERTKVQARKSSSEKRIERRKRREQKLR